MWIAARAAHPHPAAKPRIMYGWSTCPCACGMHHLVSPRQPHVLHDAPGEAQASTTSCKQLALTCRCATAAAQHLSMSGSCCSRQRRPGCRPSPPPHATGRQAAGGHVTAAAAGAVGAAAGESCLSTNSVSVACGSVCGMYLLRDVPLLQQDFHACMHAHGHDVHMCMHSYLHSAC